ncbi:hypothetical protein ORM83_23750 [Bacillus cereus]|uniref:hypothetical protein n=1 Tax=Bacillus cereus TaxID=1396 RepID=UPI0022E83215|nr:hypothetical protein [Bacillus cereus]MDZ4432461.1 hypothetical protein [Bacillus cereus]MDZ4511920.1 hypothetical protein [Bacillus cereus]MDZ4648184.1 hypothetical protein [Bacillus cereus]
MMITDHIKVTIINSIMDSFKQFNIKMGDACAYTSYLTRDLLKEKYNIDSQLAAGELHFAPPINIAYLWNPKHEFHMWVKLNGEIIDIAVGGLKQRKEFQPGGKYYKYRNEEFYTIWDNPSEINRIHREIEGGVKQIDSPVDAEDYKKLYTYASNLIDSKNYR